MVARVHADSILYLGCKNCFYLAYYKITLGARSLCNETPRLRQLRWCVPARSLLLGEGFAEYLEAAEKQFL